MKAGLGVAFAPIGRAQRHYTFKRINLVAAAVAVTTVAGLSPAAYGDGFLLEEVLVTAQKREQSVNDIGMAVTAYQGSDLETLGFNDSRDLANLVPGLTMAMSSSGTPIYTMRGVVVSDLIPLICPLAHRWESILMRFPTPTPS